MNFKTALLTVLLSFPLISTAATNTVALQQALQSLDQANAQLYNASQSVQMARSAVISAMQAPQSGWVCVLSYSGDHKGIGSTEQSARDAAVDACAESMPMNQCKLFRDGNYTTCHMIQN